MKINYALIITMNRDYYSDIADSLQEEGIEFYPNNDKDARQLRRCIDLFYCSNKQEKIKEGVDEIMKIIDNLPEKTLCIIDHQLVKEDEYIRKIDDLSFVKFHTQFILPNNKIDTFVFFADFCSCEYCRKSEKKAKEYCEGKNIVHMKWVQIGAVIGDETNYDKITISNFLRENFSEKALY